MSQDRFDKQEMPDVSLKDSDGEQKVSGGHLGISLHFLLIVHF